jgi:hypothetical protein
MQQAAAVRTEQQICEPPRTTSKVGASTKRRAITVGTNIGFFAEIAQSSPQCLWRFIRVTMR